MNDLIVNAQANLIALEQGKVKILQALQAHVGEHQAIISEHQAEIDAAHKLMGIADPKPAPPASSALLLLTKPRKINENWRYWVMGACALIVVAGWIFAK